MENCPVTPPPLVPLVKARCGHSRVTCWSVCD